MLSAYVHNIRQIIIFWYFTCLTNWFFKETASRCLHRWLWRYMYGLTYLCSTPMPPFNTSPQHMLCVFKQMLYTFSCFFVIAAFKYYQNKTPHTYKTNIHITNVAEKNRTTFLKIGGHYHSSLLVFLLCVQQVCRQLVYISHLVLCATHWNWTCVGHAFSCRKMYEHIFCIICTGALKCGQTETVQYAKQFEHTVVETFTRLCGQITQLWYCREDDSIRPTCIQAHRL